MRRIALITDSSCDLDFSSREEHKVEMIPFRIIYKDREYLDQITITENELYDSLETEIPTTSLPDLGYGNKVIERLKAEGYTDIIAITVSSKLSGSFNSLKILSQEHEEIKFHFFDSKTLGYPVGVIVMEASRLIKLGFSPEEIVDKLEGIRTRTHAFVTFKTLEFLKRGGRIGRVAGTVGEILNLKPIISSNEEGVLYNFAKCRGRKQAISKMKEIINEYLSRGKCRIWVLSGSAHDEAISLLECIKEHVNITSISIEMVGATMGVHTGPGALGVCIFEE